MRKPSPRISRTLRLLVSGILLVWLISRVGYTELVDAIASSDATWMALAIASVLPSYAIRSFSLHTITNKNGRVVTYGQSFSLTLVGVASSLFLPPGVADAARAHIGYRALGKPETVVSATLLDRATSLVALGMLGAVAAYLEGATLAAMISGAIGLAALVAVAIPRLLPWAWVIKIISGGAKIDPDRVVDAARMPPLTLAWVLTISMGGWLFSALSVFLVSRSLGADIAFATVTVATLLASLSRLIPISAAGIGVGEWALALYLTRAGIADERAAAIALVTMVVATILPGIFGLTVKLRRSDGANATSELQSLSVNDAVI